MISKPANNEKVKLWLIVSLGIWSSVEQEPEKYTGQKLEFELFKSSDFNYSGNLIVNELTGGALEVDIQLDGAKSQDDYVFPVHCIKPKTDSSRKTIIETGIFAKNATIRFKSKVVRG